MGRGEGRRKRDAPVKVTAAAVSFLDGGFFESATLSCFCFVIVFREEGFRRKRGEVVQPAAQRSSAPPPPSASASASAAQLHPKSTPTTLTPRHERHQTPNLKPLSPNSAPKAAANPPNDNNTARRTR